MSVIQKACTKLRGCINQIENGNPSGASEQDVVNLDQVKEMLRLDKKYIKGFKFDHVWNIMKDCEKFASVPNTPRYQRHSPYQSSSPGLCSSSGSPVGINLLDLNTDEGMTFTQRPIEMKNIAKTNESLVRRNEIQAERLAIEKRAAEDKIIFTDLTSISEPEVLEYLQNEKQRILRKRAEETRANEVGQGSQYRASEYQGSGGVEEQVGGSQNANENFHLYSNGQNNWNF
ncbi:hypothetical protein OSB04_029399 [Centaurea solstitialis]|uniref:No apical meristem-associated C-terminal domain-containing protein n=1 Tax=Centaurea solstitialis TaxID=347529 RepID=A0AA38SIB6_9ASTR|nr:hypothetical protein OSB04_029399 [Centaurea solstitialis]